MRLASPTRPHLRSARLAAALGATLLALVALASPVHAQDPPAAPAPPAPSAPDADLPPTESEEDFTWGVQPVSPDGGQRDSFVYTVSPGQTVSDRVAVSNLGAAPKTFRLYGTDAFNTADGAFAVLESAAPSSDAGSWITLDASELTIDPDTRVEVPFTLTVPIDAEPGDHAAGIIAEDAAPAASAVEGGTGVAIQRRIGTRVYLRVDGATRPALSVTAISVAYDSPSNPIGTAPATVRYTVRNVGNVRLSGSTDVRVTGALGGSSSDPAPSTFNELLPGNEVVLEHTFADVSARGRLTAEVTVATADDVAPPITRSTSTWTISWTSLLIVLAIASAAAALVVLLRRRGRTAPGTDGGGGSVADDGTPSTPSAPTVRSAPRRGPAQVDHGVSAPHARDTTDVLTTDGGAR